MIRWWSKRWQAYRDSRAKLELLERDERVRALESEVYIQQREIELLAAVCARNVKRVRSETDRIGASEDDDHALRMTG